jgi:hypothetical protein
MKKIIIAVAALVMAINATANTTPPPQAPGSPVTGSVNILQLDLGDDGAVLIERGRLKQVHRNGDQVCLVPMVAQPAQPAQAGCQQAPGRPPSVLATGQAGNPPPPSGHHAPKKPQEGGHCPPNLADLAGKTAGFAASIPGTAVEVVGEGTEIVGRGVSRVGGFLGGRLNRDCCR